ncbi:hypothetical protein B0H17DRAFT_1333865 [Mycena rosella]|uniref:Uncharacterized protein n=1 Tax=Mycena rosella TaxID=1033263 RepID=A0AAD7D5Y8_MYCRO|nr:hypothetical protein B0H17DRAFT_1339878 [Mycena rosella]KAJ7680168.1 hypothetical protein B0H17DRAFT_1333865 [Mycena rosella]
MRTRGSAFYDRPWFVPTPSQRATPRTSARSLSPRPSGACMFAAARHRYAPAIARRSYAPPVDARAGAGGRRVGRGDTAACGIYGTGVSGASKRACFAYISLPWYSAGVEIGLLLFFSVKGRPLNSPGTGRTRSTSASPTLPCECLRILGSQLNEELLRVLM